MSKDNIAQQYNNMVASIEDAKIYDGRGEYNLYECNKCNNYKVTLYKDKGVTPFIMRCKCGGDMMHTKSSKQAPPSYVKVHNWVRPISMVCSGLMSALWFFLVVDLLTQKPDG